MDHMTPKEIVSELDKHIIGQSGAKRAVAIALRNRWRRMQLPVELRDEIMPKNILMIGPTGVGKTEIARRLAKLADAPFIKVEATKFTEVGYVGRDVESIIRDLLEATVTREEEQQQQVVRERAEGLAAERLLNYLCGSKNAGGANAPVSRSRAEVSRLQRQRKRVAEQLAARQIEEQVVEIEVEPEEGLGPMLE